MRIVRLANFVTARSGGLRTSLQCLGEGYLAAGHEPVLVVPGRGWSDVDTPFGRVLTLRGPVVPGTGGYRVLAGRRRLVRLLDGLRPDRLEVSDRSTLRWTGPWARSRGVPAVMVSHESLTGLLRLARVPGASRIADTLNARTARSYDRVVCTTGWAAAEFRRLGVGDVVEVPLGVDLEMFHPLRRSLALRSRLAPPDASLIVHCSRLSAEKAPGRVLTALRDLDRPAVLVVAGDGPLRSTLEHQARGLPVRFLGFLPDRSAMAALLATADVVVAPGPVETFGLAALEALASGTPVVVSAGSALPEVVGDAGVAVGANGFAAGVAEVLDRPEAARRAAARARAERFGWPAAVAGFLAAHGLAAGGPAADGPAAGGSGAGGGAGGCSGAGGGAARGAGGSGAGGVA